MITIISYLLLYHDYYFSRGRLYYTWKPKDIRAATVILFNYSLATDILANILVSLLVVWAFVYKSGDLFNTSK